MPYQHYFIVKNKLTIGIASVKTELTSVFTIRTEDSHATPVHSTIIVIELSILYNLLYQIFSLDNQTLRVHYTPMSIQTHIVSN